MDYVPPVFYTPPQADIQYVETLEANQTADVQCSKDGKSILHIKKDGVFLTKDGKEYGVEGLETLFHNFDRNVSRDATVENYAQEMSVLTAGLIKDSSVLEVLDVSKKITESVRQTGKRVNRYTDMVYHPDGHSAEEMNEARREFMEASSIISGFFMSEVSKDDFGTMAPEPVPFELASDKATKMILSDVGKQAKVNKTMAYVMTQDKDALRILKRFDKQQRAMDDASRSLMVSVYGATQAYTAEVSKDAVKELGQLMKDAEAFEKKYGDRVDVVQAFTDKDTLKSLEGSRAYTDVYRLADRFSKVYTGVNNARALIEENILFLSPDKVDLVPSRDLVEKFEPNLESYKKMDKALTEAAGKGKFGAVIRDYVLPCTDIVEVQVMAQQSVMNLRMATDMNRSKEAKRTVQQRPAEKENGVQMQRVR